MLVPHCLEKYMDIPSLGLIVLYMSVMSILSKVHIMIITSLLVFSLNDLFIVENEMM